MVYLNNDDTGIITTWPELSVNKIKERMAIITYDYNLTNKHL